MGHLPDRRTVLKAGSLIYPGALLGQRQVIRRGRASQPNVILIYCDDLGYGDLRCYGSALATPNLDAMAKQGALFEQFYSASSVCSPARAALLTGRYPTRAGVPDVLQPDSTGGLSLSETTLADMLKTAGYATMCIGKWHLGSQPQYMPTNRGFDEFYGLPYSNDMAPLPLLQNATVIELPAQLSTLTQRYTEQAVSFITRSREGPFFLYLPHTFPHVPLAPSARYQGKSGFGPYGDTVAEIDWSVGEVLRAVRDNGLEANTLVMFSSDHGPWFEGSAGRLRGRKGETREGGMRVPFLARFPGRIPEGRVCSGMATAMDVLPTVARLCGATQPPNALDGVDIWPLMSGQAGSVDRPAFLYFDSSYVLCVRSGPWKLHVARNNTPPWIPLPTPQWRKSVALSHPELYNIDADPGESYDLAGEHPSIVASLRAQIDALLPTFPASVQSSWNSMMKSAPSYCFSGGWPS